MKLSTKEWLNVVARVELASPISFLSILTKLSAHSSTTSANDVFDTCRVCGLSSLDGADQTLVDKKSLLLSLSSGSHACRVLASREKGAPSDFLEASVSARDREEIELYSRGHNTTGWTSSSHKLNG